MSVLLDVLGGVIIGGMMLLLAISTSFNGMQEFFNQNSDTIVQRRLAQISNVLEYDLKKMGFNIPENDQVIFQADSNHLKFISQLNSHTQLNIGISILDQVPDTIEYEILARDTIDYRDTILVQYAIQRTAKISGQATESYSIGKVGNQSVFTYLDQAGRETTTLTQIKTVALKLSAYNPRVVLSPELVMKNIGNQSDIENRKRELRRLLRPSYWRQAKIVSRNLKR